MDKSEKIATILKTLPPVPGIYQYYDSEGKIIYVGKAKNLKNRVSSYFNKVQYENRKTQVLVKNIADIKFIVVNTELESLLLENTLIKKHQPRFNIQLKDDKTFPWICIKKEPFPRIFPTRKKVKDGSEYFGPYTSVKTLRAVLDLIKQLYSIRTCQLKLTKENIEAKKFKVCLEYHIGNCKGPCEAKQTSDDYTEMIRQIRNILKGNVNDVAKHFKSIMQEFSSDYKFEEAQQIKDKIDYLEKFKDKNVVVHPDIDDVDVFSVESDAKFAYVNMLRISSGAIIQGHTIEMKKKLDETDEELLLMGMVELRNLFASDSKEIILPFEVELEIPNVKITVPQRGDKKLLLELSQRNVKYFKLDKLKQLEIKDPQSHADRILETMMKDLRMQVLPRHIECFDNSNFQGAFPVSAMVCFKDAKPSKKDYRHFNIKTVEGPDDFATMKEVLTRRYTRLIAEEQPLPQLIIVDGGKGQLSMAVEVLDELGLRGQITVIGIAKRLEEIFYPGDSLPLYIDKRSETLKVIQQMRNEAHRFGITHYRKRHQKSLIKSELVDIAGIGESTSMELLRHFKSVKQIKEAPIEELEKVIGASRAKKVYEFFHPNPVG
jgi:excinuclease ABC subunit C